MEIILTIENLGSGGAERQLTRLAVSLKEFGHNVCIVTWGKPQFHKAYLHEYGIEHIMIPDYPKIKRVFTLAKLYRNRHPRAVIAYLPSANATAILAKTIAHVPCLIVSERSFTQRWSINTRLRYVLYRFANNVVANSNNEAKNICKNIPSLTSKVTTIPNLVEVDKFTPNYNNKKTSDTPTRLISVGRITATKNIISTLQALKKLVDAGHNITLDWYGEAYDKKYTNYIKNLTNALSLRDHFTLQGATTNIHNILPQYDIFFFPSLLEGYPNVLCEAMSCGLPVVSSNACEMPYILIEGLGGYLFDPTDINAMTCALEKMLKTSTEQRHKMGTYNRGKIIANNSPQEIVKQYLALI